MPRQTPAPGRSGVPRDSRTLHPLLPEGHGSRVLFCNLKFLGHETLQNCFRPLDLGGGGQQGV